MALPFDRFLNLVYVFAVEGAEEKDKNRFDARLNMPDPSRKTAVPEASPWSAQAEQNSLSELAFALGGA